MLIIDAAIIAKSKVTCVYASRRLSRIPITFASKRREGRRGDGRCSWASSAREELDRVGPTADESPSPTQTPSECLAAHADRPVELLVHQRAAVEAVRGQRPSGFALGTMIRPIAIRVGNVIEVLLDRANAGVWDLHRSPFSGSRLTP